MKIVVDTNIVFSAILNSSSNIGKILIHHRHNYEFYSCEFLKDEIFSHRSKLLKLTKLDEEDLDELIGLSTKRIEFIDQRILPARDWKFALELLAKIDLKDAPFLALSRHLRAKLWTGDNQLRKGLVQHGFQNQVVSTTDLINRLYKK